MRRGTSRGARSSATACDTIDNVDMAVLEQMTETLMGATVSLGGIEDGLAKGAATQEGAG
ncbi:hypothetical protein Q2T94_14990 [Paeniglutamicibacter sulfureus]|uniref:hypothetical protein n=1 Tax=Paeniglutamicibacter sulfureus TaxID=43666 RepID=UPI0026669B7F|nr:hypothetical protein [Paeniglutamicibacter sulfureus]MDO2935614.1 hypothetical protein [Paeniglutamicibacter sulfureus]